MWDNTIIKLKMWDNTITLIICVQSSVLCRIEKIWDNTITLIICVQSSVLCRIEKMWDNTITRIKPPHSKKKLKQYKNLQKYKLESIKKGD